jgi:LuxR family maltose regulon positive regulatory protein
MRQMTVSTLARSGTRPDQIAPDNDPFLGSKITAPALPGWVIPRPRLTGHIAAGAALPLTVVTGPPGAGKTTALAAWAASSTPGTVAWVTVDDYDNLPRTFWSSVAEALHQAGVAVPHAVPVLSGGGGIDPAFLRQLASALAAQHPPVFLVLDDLHLITAAASLQELAYLLRYARPGLRVMAAARTDPPLPLHRYRLAGELAEIGAGELSFTVPEAARLMAQHGITLPAQTLELITRRVEGWAAGLRLAALSLDGHPDPALFIKNLAAEDNAITSYLVAEALDAQPVGTRELMLKTSVLHRVSAGLARELTGDEQAAATLTTLVRANAFVQPAGPGWYRYHPLLAEVLRMKLRREAPASVPGLHQRAASWYQQNGLPAEAVAHAAETGDWQRAARIVVDELAIGDLIDPRGSSPIAGRLRQMPDPAALPGGPPRPQPLLAAAALQLADGQDRAYGGPLAAAEHVLERLPADQEVTSRLAAALIRFTAARRSGDLTRARSAASKAQLLFGQLPADQRIRHPRAHAQVLAARGAVDLWTGDFTAATAIFSAAAAAAPEGSLERTACRGHLALIAALDGRLNRACELAEAGTTPPADAAVPSAAVALALVHLERHEPARCRSRLWQADSALRAHPDRLVAALAFLVAARSALTRSRCSYAADLLQRARHGWSPPPWLDHLLAVAESQVSTAAGDIQTALDAAGRAGAGSALDASVALARAWLVAGDIQAARQALASAADAADDSASAGARLEAYLTDAVISYRSGDRGRGHRCLERALRLGEPERYRLPFIVDWAWIWPALRHYPRLATASCWLAGPGQELPGGTPARPAGAVPPAPVVTQPLSRREREVLQHAASLLTTAEIASEMYVSVNTVKSHLKNTFRKLGAATRGEAVRRARQLGLI